MEASQEAAFKEAFETLADPLFRHAFYRLSDRERAYDLAQEAFLKTWDHLVGGGEVRHFKSFLYRTLNNLIIDEYRRKKSRSLDEMLEDESRAPSVEASLAEGSRAETEAALDDELAIARIRERMHDLSLQHREVLTLRYIDGLQIPEIALMLSVTENVVSVRIHRALSRLRELCEDIDTV